MKKAEKEAEKEITTLLDEHLIQELGERLEMDIVIGDPIIGGTPGGGIGIGLPFRY